MPALEPAEEPVNVSSAAIEAVPTSGSGAQPSGRDEPTEAASVEEEGTVPQALLIEPPRTPAPNVTNPIVALRAHNNTPVATVAPTVVRPVPQNPAAQPNFANVVQTVTIAICLARMNDWLFVSSDFILLASIVAYVALPSGWVLFLMGVAPIGPTTSSP